MTQLTQEPVEGNGSTPPVNDVPTVETLQGQLTAVNKMLEDVKKSQSGSDAAVTAKNLEIEELRNSLKEKMTDSERTKAEAAEDKERMLSLAKDLEDIKATSARDKLNSYKMEKMAEVKLPVIFFKNIHGNTKEEIDAEIETFAKGLADRDKELLKAGYSTDPPANGSASNGEKQMSRADFDNLSPTAKAETASAGVKITE